MKTVYQSCCSAAYFVRAERRPDEDTQHDPSEMIDPDDLAQSYDDLLAVTETQSEIIADLRAKLASLTDEVALT